MPSTFSDLLCANAGSILIRFITNGIVPSMDTAIMAFGAVAAPTTEPRYGSHFKSHVKRRRDRVKTGTVRSFS